MLAELKKRNVRWKDPVQRYKGLGEMDADQLADTTMDTRHRTLRRRHASTTPRAPTGVFELLMGTDVAPAQGLHRAGRLRGRRRGALRLIYCGRRILLYTFSRPAGGRRASTRQRSANARRTHESGQERGGASALTWAVLSGPGRAARGVEVKM